jgi:hypothetical protein
MTGRELLAALDEELDRLHARYREPLVLCYLEGLTRDEAAARLGVPPATLKTRLERGRQRLHDALTRRGCTLGAGLLALCVGSPAPAASSCLVKGILAAVGDSPSTTVAALARGALVSSFMHRLLRVALSAAAIIACLGIGVWAAWPAVGGQTPAKEQPAKAAAPDAKPKPAAEKKGRAISGRVVDRAGKPVAKATILVPRWEPGWEVVVKEELAMTDVNGHFRCVVPPPGQHLRAFDNRQLVARARGFAAAWVVMGEVDSSRPVVFRLGTAKIRVRGRVLTLEGKPIANASVNVGGVTVLNEKDGLKGLYQCWNARYRGEGWPEKHLFFTSVAGLPDKLTTDAQGRFEIDGVGDGRLLRLWISADTIETVTVGVVLDPAFDNKAVRINPPDINPSTGRPQPNSPLYGSTFDHFARPCRVIQGRVFDQKTKKPLSDIAITAQTMGRDKNGHTQTDAAGRFRITGLPNAQCDVLFNYSWKPTPYLTLVKTVKPTPGLAPATVEMGLVRGTVITCRVMDRLTGETIIGSVTYNILQGNKHIANLPGQDIHHAGIGGGSYNLDDDGRFRFVAPPGPGIIQFRTHILPQIQKPYPRARMSAVDRKKPYFHTDARGDGFLTSAGYKLDLRNVNAFRIIEPAVGQESVKVDIRLDPGKSIAGKVVGPDGQPVAGASITGLTGFREIFSKLSGEAFTLQAVLQDESRTVTAFHADKKLAATIVVGRSDKEPVVLRLSGWGAVTGRIVNKDGVPLGGASVRLRYRPQTAMPLNLKLARGEPAKTDSAGRFRIDVPFAGFEFTLMVNYRNLPGLCQVPGGTVKPGQTKALGDVIVKEEEQVSAK